MPVRKKIPKEVRQAVYDKFNGHCAYCGCKLEYKDMQIDHIDSVHKAKYYGEDVNDDFSNYFPACRACNFYKSTFSIEEFRNNISTKLYENLAKTFNYKLLRKYNQIVPDVHRVLFYFEKMRYTMKIDTLNAYCDGISGCDECLLKTVIDCDKISDFEELGIDGINKCYEIVCQLIDSHTDNDK